MRRVVIIGGLLVAFFLTWVAGTWTGGYRERHQRYLDEQQLITPVLTGNPDLENVKVIEETGPGGGILLFGTVKSQTARDRLKTELARLFGEPRAKSLMEWDGLAVDPNPMR